MTSPFPITVPGSCFVLAQQPLHRVMLSLLAHYLRPFVVTTVAEPTAAPEPPAEPPAEPAIAEPAIAEPPETAPPPEPVVVAAPPPEPSILDNRPFVKLAERCVELYDELYDASRHFDAARHEVATHVLERLQDTLSVCGVEIIDQDAAFDRSLHQPVQKTSGIAPGDPGWVARIRSPGFRLERRVLRRAHADIEHVETES